MLDFDALAKDMIQNKYGNYLINKKNGAFHRFTFKDYDSFLKHPDEQIKAKIGEEGDCRLVFSMNHEQTWWVRDRFLCECKAKKAIKQEGFDLIEGKATPARFNAFLKRNGLSESYAEYYARSVKLMLANDLFFMEIPEEEASGDQYKAIRAWLEKISQRRFEKILTDGYLFDLDERPLGFHSFNIIGHEDGTYGICFYPDDYYCSTYRAIMENLTPAISPCIGTLGRSVSFYYEWIKGPEEDNEIFKKYPVYGEDQSYSSVLFNKGRCVRNRFSRSQAFLLEHYLGLAYRLLEKAILSKSLVFPDPDPYCVLLCQLRETGYKIIRHDAGDLVDDVDSASHLLHSGWGRMKNPPNLKGGKRNIAYDFSVGLLQLLADSDDVDDNRYFSCAYALILAETKTGYVLPPSMFARKEGQSLYEALFDATENVFPKIDAPTVIYTNSGLEYALAEFLFNNGGNGPRVSLVNEALASEEARDAMMKELDSLDRRGDA